MTTENVPANEFIGTTVVVTGASSGIGLAAAEGFARGGARVALVGRDPARLDQALARVRAAAAEQSATPEPAAYRADFTRLDDVRALARELRDAYPHIDVLANNAGGTYRSRTTTTDGFESTMQTNHLAPFLLTNLLRTNLDGGRVINTASDVHRFGKLDPNDLNSERSYSRITAYGTSKQANILFAAEAARRWPEIDSYAYHPGVVRTRFGSDSGVITMFYKIWPFLNSPAQGADTMLWLASQRRSELVDGGYYARRKRLEPTSRARDAATATALWTASETAVGL